MHTIARLYTAPANLDDFVTEIKPDFKALYGTAAATFYVRLAVSGITTSINNSTIHAYGCMVHGDTIGILFVNEADERYVINFLHVLLPFRGLGVEEALLEFALRELERNPGSIVTEFIPYYPMALESAIARHGFGKVDRQLMRRPPWTSSACAPEGFVLCASNETVLPEFADVLVETYAHHDEHFLFPEVQSLERARAYLRRVQSGAFGIYHPNFGIGAWRDGNCAGFVIGAQTLPGLGFTLHLAVRPEFRGRGLGRALLGSLATAYRVAGLDYIALGVTCDNPAVSLYQRAGFDCVKRIPVYHRP